MNWCTVEHRATGDHIAGNRQPGVVDLDRPMMRSDRQTIALPQIDRRVMGITETRSAFSDGVENRFDVGG